MAASDPLNFVLVLDDVENGLEPLVREICARPVHTIYIDPIRCGSVHAFGKSLAEKLKAQVASSPLTDAQAEEVRHLRGSYVFRAETDPRVSIQQSEDLHGWTVVCEEDTLFAITCAPRFVYVKPKPSNWSEALFMVGSELTGVRLWPAQASVIGLPENLTVTSLGEGVEDDVDS